MHTAYRGKKNLQLLRGHVEENLCQEKLITELWTAVLELTALVPSSCS